MKNITFVLFLFAAICAKAQSTSTFEIEIEIENLKNDKGVCRACLFNNAKAFPSESDKAVSCKAVTISGTKAKLVFENVPPGTYAVSVFHDENNNNRLDQNFMGIPKEGYGASKNALPMMSKPSFEENAFKVSDKSLNLSVKIRY